MRWTIKSLLLFCLIGCSEASEVEPSGPIARFGTTPTIDGVFEFGEWDDAATVQVGQYQRFRIKHDGTNLYYALIGDGGNLYFHKEDVIQILHVSAQLGLAEYRKSDDSDAQSNLESSDYQLVKAFDYQLYGLQDEPADGIKKKMADYLAKNGWVGSIGGRQAQSEFAVSFEFLGITTGSGRFFKTPHHYVYSGRLFSREEIEKLLKLSLEERKERFPTLYWPEEPVPSDSLNTGSCPDTIRLDPTNWGAIWIDLGDRSSVKQ